MPKTQVLLFLFLLLIDNSTQLCASMELKLLTAWNSHVLKHIFAIISDVGCAAARAGGSQKSIGGHARGT